MIRLLESGPDDEPFLLRLYISTRIDEVKSWGWGEREAEQFLSMQYRFQSRDYLCRFQGAAFRIIAMEQTKIGRLIVDRGERFIRLVDLSLLPEYRSRGIGTSILLSLQEESADTGRPIVLQVFETNRAKTLYQRLGFVCTAKEGMYETMQWRPQASRIT